MSTETPSYVPKAILYSWRTSVWASIPLLCLIEKGYSSEEYTVKEVDITKGENFSPAYLKINANGTVPTLVVPTAETTGADVVHRYRSLRDTMTIAEFLDHARSAQTTHTVSEAPAPALAPATIEGKTLSDSLTALVHLPTVDPNFLYLSARNSQELETKTKSDAGRFVRNRQTAIKQYIQEAEEELRQKLDTLSSTSGGDSPMGNQGSRSGSASASASASSGTSGGSGNGNSNIGNQRTKGDTGSPFSQALTGAHQSKSPDALSEESPAPPKHAGAVFEAKTVAFLRSKEEANELLNEIYSGTAPPERLQGFFDAGNKAWSESLPDVLEKLDAAMTGPYALGDHISLADIHIISWLSRLVQITTGKFEPEGITGLEKNIGTGFVAGEKVKSFWKAWVARESFKKVFPQRFLGHEHS